MTETVHFKYTKITVENVTTQTQRALSLLGPQRDRNKFKKFEAFEK